MSIEKRTVQLTSAQIAFVRESLTYSAKAFRDAAYEGLDYTWVAEHRRQNEETIASIRAALAVASRS